MVTDEELLALARAENPDVATMSGGFALGAVYDAYHDTLPVSVDAGTPEAFDENARLARRIVVLALCAADGYERAARQLRAGGA